MTSAQPPSGAGSLWPTDFSKVPDLRTPFDILKEQSEYLKKQTAGRLSLGWEKVRESDLGEQAVIEIRSAASKYRHSLFFMDYGTVSPYPVRLHIYSVGYVAKDEQDFRGYLHMAFNSDHTQRALKKLTEGVAT